MEEDAPALCAIRLSQAIPRLAHTKIQSLTVGTKEYYLQSWMEMLVQVARIARASKHGDLLEEVTPEAYSFTTRKVIFSRDPQQLHTPREIGDGLYVETNFDATTLAKFAAWIAYWCDLDQNSFVLKYLLPQVKSLEAMRGAVLSSNKTAPQERPVVWEPKPSSEEEASKVSEATEIAILPGRRYDLTDTKPVCFTFLDGETYFVDSWRKFAIAFSKLLFRIAEDEVVKRVREQAHSSATVASRGLATGKLYPSPNGLTKPAEVYDRLWIEVNNPANRLLESVINLAQTLEIDLEDIPCTVKIVPGAGKSVEENNIKFRPTATPRPVVTNPKEQVASAELQTMALSPALNALVTGTRPFRFSFLGKSYSLSSWKDFLQVFAQELIAVTGASSEQLLRVGKSVKLNPQGMLRPRQLTAECWIETNQGSPSLVTLALKLAAILNWDLQRNPCNVEFGRTAREMERPSEKRDQAETTRIELDFNLPELRQTLLEYFPNGISLSPTSLQLLASHFPPEKREAVTEENLRRMTFARVDSVRLLPEMVASEEITDRLRSRIKQLLDDYPAFALANLYEDFAGELHNLGNELRNFELFLRNWALPEEFVIAGEELKAICRPRRVALEETWQELANRVHLALTNAGDALSQDELLGDFPNLNGELLEFLCQELLDDVITSTLDEQKYWKLLEFYYLPDDFAAELQRIVEQTEKTIGGTALSILIQALQERYGTTFCYDYALEDAAVLKQVISAAWNGLLHRWKGALFVPANQGKKQDAPVKQTPVRLVDAFKLQQKGVFHEDDFFQFALQTRDMKAPGASLVLGYLTKSFIRLTEKLWISEEEFFQSGAVSSEVWQPIEEKLFQYLANRPFFPLKDLPTFFYDDLPPVQFAEKLWYWNPFFLVSVAIHLSEKFNITNCAAAPYRTTAYIFPKHCTIDTQAEYGAVDYVLDCYLQIPTNPRDVNGAFLFLQENNVRLRKRSQLLEHIRQYLKGK